MTIRPRKLKARSNKKQKPMRWFFSPILIVLGVIIMKYCVAIGNFTGAIPFAEKYLQTFGGTYFLFKLVGLGACIFGLLWLTGVISYDSGRELDLQQGSIHIVRFLT